RERRVSAARRDQLGDLGYVGLPDLEVVRHGSLRPVPVIIEIPNEEHQAAVFQQGRGRETERNAPDARGSISRPQPEDATPEVCHRVTAELCLSTRHRFVHDSMVPSAGAGRRAAGDQQHVTTTDAVENGPSESERVNTFPSTMILTVMPPRS